MLLELAVLDHLSPGTKGPPIFVHTLDLSSSRNSRDGDGADIGSSVLNMPNRSKSPCDVILSGW